MEYTSNYQLPTWVETDRIQMDDFNDMTGKIDAALGEHDETLTEHTAAIAAKGDCQIYATTYVGNGTESLTLTFPKPPRLVTAMGGNGGLILTIYGASNGLFRGTGGIYSTLPVSWSGNSVTWSNKDSFELCNMADTTYSLLALLEA